MNNDKFLKTFDLIPSILFPCFVSLQDIFLMFDKNKTKRLEYQEVKPALREAGKTFRVKKKLNCSFYGTF